MLGEVQEQGLHSAGMSRRGVDAQGSPAGRCCAWGSPAAGHDEDVQGRRSAALIEVSVRLTQSHNSPR